VQCKGVFTRIQTLLLDTKKGRFRLCRDCFNRYEQSKLDQEYKETKDNLLLFNVKETDAYELMKKKEKFLKDIKEGRI
jgi:hypothetical protein